nr:MBL fold metallo-hydrolase [Burkholderiaceae bacterium]
MNALEHFLQYPLGDQLPGPAARVEVAPGIHWIRMPLPFALDHINLWLLRDQHDGEGWTLIDCGISSAETQALWQRVFESGLEGLPIRRILCTHT